MTTWIVTRRTEGEDTERRVSAHHYIHCDGWLVFRDANKQMLVTMPERDIFSIANADFL